MLFVAEETCITKTLQNIRAMPQGLPKEKCRFVGEGKAYASSQRGEIFCEVVFLALTIFQKISENLCFKKKNFWKIFSLMKNEENDF